MKRLPTDREILRAIYDRYYSDYMSFDKASPLRTAKNYVPLDIPEIAASLGVDGEVVFARLYYHFRPKFTLVDGKTRTPFFAKQLFDSTDPKDRHVVNFPMLTSVLADLDYEYRKTRLPLRVSMFSAGISVAALVANILLTILKNRGGG
jgi:hypothetical protein